MSRAATTTERAAIAAVVSVAAGACADWRTSQARDSKAAAVAHTSAATSIAIWLMRIARLRYLFGYVM
jgi:hypothetical protein